MLGISESTVRRDLQKLSESGVVRRSHGGAILAEYTSHEPMFAERRQQNQDEKIRIGRFARQFIQPGQSVIFDSSSTVLTVVEALREQPLPIIAVTNDINIASELSAIPEIQVHVTGGEIRPGSFTLYGSQAQSFLSSIHADVALMGIHAITGIKLSDSSIRIVAMKKMILNSARRIILLADHSKFGPSAFIEVENLHMVHDLVTTDLAPKGALEVINRDSKHTLVHLI
jgi:DeoR family transcriptional regulator of aga operon